MRLRWHTIILLVLAVGGVSASAIYFSMKASVDVIEDEILVSPSSFSIDIAKGAHYVKEIEVKNSGGETEIYFEKVVEGPDKNAIRVSFHTQSGESITSSNKLKLPAGTSDNPSVTAVNVHIDVDDEAPVGSYTIYIHAKG